MMTREQMAAWYGNEMRRYGMSNYNERMNTPDPTPKLREMKEFQEMSESDQKSLLEFGRNSYLYGMGQYQERGFAAEYYNKLHGKPPESPFIVKKTEPQKISETELDPEVADYIKKVDASIKRFEAFYCGNKFFEKKDSEAIIDTMKFKCDIARKKNETDDNNMLNEFETICDILSLLEDNPDKAKRVYKSFAGGQILSKIFLTVALLKSKYSEVFAEEIRQEYFNALKNRTGQQREIAKENLKHIDFLLTKIEEEQEEKQNQPN